MNGKRLLRIVMAFTTALVIIGPLAYLLIAYGLISGMMGYETKWVSIVVIIIAVILVVAVTGLFTLREIKTSSKNKVNT